MKKILVIAAMLISVSASATPKIGDYAEFVLGVGRDGQSLPGVFSQEVTAFDAAQNTYNVKTSYQLQGQDSPTVEDAVRPVDSFLSDETIDMMLNNCNSVQGVLETIRVPAGEFNACKLPFDNEEASGFVWVAKVSFGMAKLDQINKANGLHILLDLKNFR